MRSYGSMKSNYFPSKKGFTLYLSVIKHPVINQNLFIFRRKGFQLVLTKITCLNFTQKQPRSSLTDCNSSYVISLCIFKANYCEDARPQRRQQGTGIDLELHHPRNQSRPETRKQQRIQFQHQPSLEYVTFAGFPSASQSCQQKLYKYLQQLFIF